jgi:2-polyprenyl-3-methyl-5-hydroxy-6-metoxy-1,4-benzoquinol methylase
MPIDFFVDKNRYTYADRNADNGWDATIVDWVDPAGRRVVDVGCGGGIYSLAWHELGCCCKTERPKM